MIIRASHMRVARRLPLMIIALMSFLCAGISVFAFRHLSSALHEKAADQVSALASGYVSSIEDWLRGYERELKGLAANSATAEALNGLSSARRLMGEQANEALHRLYVQENPHRVGERHLLTTVESEGFYHPVHARTHDQFLKLRDVMRYKDVYLIDNDGNVVYSVSKHSDYATNLIDGPFSQSALADVFQQALVSEAGTVIKSDLAPYQAADGAIAGFFAVPVFRNATEVLGVLAVRVPFADLTAALRVPTLLEAYGDVYVLGQDGRARVSIQNWWWLSGTCCSTRFCQRV